MRRENLLAADHSADFFAGMAWRIDEWVIRGEIDNRVRGRVTGRIWFTGRAEPVELSLTGDCWRDLAGRRLEFVNPQPKPGLPTSFATRQEGVASTIEQVRTRRGYRRTSVRDVLSRALRDSS